MSRNSNFFVLLTTITVAMAIAGVAGRRAAPGSWLADQRRSTYLAGPNGTAGFAEILRRLDVDVERIRAPLFRLVPDSGPSQFEWIVVMDPMVPLVDRERDQLLRHVERGGALLGVGSTGLERCFGLEVRHVGFEVDPPSTELEVDDGLVYDWPDRRFEWIDQDVDPPMALFAGSESPCDVPDILSAAPLVRTVAGSVVAWRFTVEGGGRILLLAESQFLSNAALRDTDVGVLVFPWILNEAPSRIAFDEYHLGFDDGGSIFTATWQWMTGDPIGWGLLQLALAVTVVLFTAAIRFGPALRAVDGKRRSPLEHLSALAVGLERADGHTTAVHLIVNGLRRRLGRSSITARAGDTVDAWIATLGTASRGRGVQVAFATLSQRVRRARNSNDVLEAAQAVEDVWEALREDKQFKRS